MIFLKLTFSNDFFALKKLKSQFKCLVDHINHFHLHVSLTDIHTRLRFSNEILARIRNNFAKIGTNVLSFSDFCRSHDDDTQRAMTSLEACSIDFFPFLARSRFTHSVLLVYSEEVNGISAQTLRCMQKVFLLLSKC